MREAGLTNLFKASYEVKASPNPFIIYIKEVYIGHETYSFM